MEDTDWQVVPQSEISKQEDISIIANHHYEPIRQEEAIADIIAVVVGSSEGTTSRGPDREEFKSRSGGSRLPSRLPSSRSSAVCSAGVLNLRYSGTASPVGNESENVEDLLKLTPSLEACLHLNIALQRRFQEKVNKLEKRLETVVNRETQLEMLIEDIENKEKSKGLAEKPLLRISNFCVPYFKNASGMNAPKNSDGKFKIENGYIDLYTTRTRPWTTIEKKALKQGVLKEWSQQLLEMKNTELRNLQRAEKKLREKDGVEKSIEDLKKLRDNMAILERQIRATSIKKLTVPPPKQKMDWEKIAAQTFDGHRTGEECHLMWENYVHPNINTGLWTQKEDLEIQNLVFASNNQKSPDWDKIAVKLGTRRTAFLVMQRWVSFIYPTLYPIRWTGEDNTKLIDTVNLLRTGSFIPWAQVHQHMVGFTRSQIQGRWRLVNPDISKGRFTIEEDNILIKGLHLYGLNFLSITHFMSGRSCGQVRDRYRRTILPNFTDKPWKKHEDDIIIKEGKTGSKNWMKIALEKLPDRNSCQIRMRYHIMQVWQSISQNNTRPPFLFPLSTTTDVDKIEEIRQSMSKDSPFIKILIDKSRERTEDFKYDVMKLENQRKEMQARNTEASISKLRRLTEKRGRVIGHTPVSKVKTEESSLTNFFLPYRKYPGKICISSLTTQTNLVALGRIFQLKILQEVTPAERGMMLSRLQLKEEDIIAVNLLVTKHSHEGAAPDTVHRNCDGCKPPCPGAISLMPPSQTTLGAFSSLLINRPMLDIIASGKMAKLKRKNDESLGPPENKRIKKEVESPVKDSPVIEKDPLAIEEPLPGPSTQFMSYSPTAGSRMPIQGKVHITAMKKSGSAAQKQLQGVINTYPKGKLSCQNWCETGLVMKPTCEATEQQNVSQERLREKRERQAADELLFHRMLSLFYWPMLMTTVNPPKNEAKVVQHEWDKKVKIRYCKGKVIKGLAPVVTEKEIHPSNIKTLLDIEEQEEYIQQLEEKESQASEPSQKMGVSNERVHIESQTEEGRPGDETVADGEYSQDGIEAASTDTGAAECQNYPGADGSSGESQNMSMSQVRRQESFRKKYLTGLRRSLVMKKVWEQRKKGVRPYCKQERVKREYQPRRSRTRDCTSVSTETPQPEDVEADPTEETGTTSGT